MVQFASPHAVFRRSLRIGLLAVALVWTAPGADAATSVAWPKATLPGSIFSTADSSAANNQLPPARESPETVADTMGGTPSETPAADPVSSQEDAAVETWEVIFVNEFDDYADASPGLGGCDAGGGICSLRAAVMEASARAPTGSSS